MTHTDQVVANRPQAYPNFHAVVAFVAAAVQSMAPLEHANPTFASGSPLLPLLEPACLLQLSSLLALGRAVRHRNPLDSHVVGRLLPARRVNPRVPRHKVRNATQPFMMHLDGWHQQ